LIERGADVNSTSHSGVTPLIIATAAGHAEAVEVLLKAGADLSKADDQGMTALDWAKKRGHTALVERLQAALPG
jgi:ankyrin repeat protein